MTGKAALSDEFLACLMLFPQKLDFVIIYGRQGAWEGFSEVQWGRGATFLRLSLAS